MVNSRYDTQKALMICKNHQGFFVFSLAKEKHLRSPLGSRAKPVSECDGPEESACAHAMRHRSADDDGLRRDKRRPGAFANLGSKGSALGRRRQLFLSHERSNRAVVLFQTVSARSSTSSPRTAASLKSTSRTKAGSFRLTLFLWGAGVR